MSKTFINNFDIDFQCPNCNNTLKISSKDISSTINCQFCHQEIYLKDDGFSDGLKQANKELDNFTKNLKKMFK